MASVSYSIRLRVILIVALSITAILTSGYLVTRHYVKEEMQELSRSQLSMLAESLKNTIVEMMKSGADDQSLDAAYARIVNKQPEILSLRVLHGNALNRQFGVHKDELPESELEKRSLQSRDALIEQLEGEAAVTEFVYPLFAEQVCLSCHQAELGESLGILSMRLDNSEVNRTIAEEKIELLQLSVIETLLLLALLLWALNRLVFKPLSRLAEGANRMAKGDLSADIDGEEISELGVVVKSFNHMAGKIRLLLGDQEKVIEEQAMELTHLMETSQFIGSEQPLPDTLAQFSKTLVEMLNVTTCRMVMLNEEEQLHVDVEYPVRPLAGEPYPQGSRESCPLIWTVIAQNEYLLVTQQEKMSDTERVLMRLDQGDAALCVPISNKGRVFGVAVLSEFRIPERNPIDDRKVHLCRAMVSQMGAAIEMAKLYERLVEQLMETVLAMAESVEKKSPWTAGHSRRVTKYALCIAVEMGWREEQLEQLRIAGLLHDIGKIAVPGSILNKQGRLDDDEFAIIKRHPEDGAQILSKIRMMRPYIPIIRHHHEWVDGSGYPDGLRGAEIPLGARVVAVADAFDAMSADRPYRQGLNADAAISRLEEAVGSQFDGEIVEALKRCRHNLK